MIKGKDRQSLTKLRAAASVETNSSRYVRYDRRPSSPVRVLATFLNRHLSFFDRSANFVRNRLRDFRKKKTPFIFYMKFVAPSALRRLDEKR